jgi:hypothetical protein
MKKIISNVMKAVFTVILCGMIFSVLPETNVHAKMTNKKAWNILLEKLYGKYTRNTFIDLDNDKIDELIVLGYSGEFVDGVDTEKTLTVYRVKGNKAKKIFNCSIEGDYFRPTLDFRLFYNDAYYMSVDYVHEGYGYTKTYKYTGKKFKQVSGVDMNLAEGEYTYYVGKKNVSQKKYDKYMKDIFASPVYPTVSDCDCDHTFNEYVEKMLKAEYDFRFENDLFEEQPTGTSFVDIDGDYFSELRVDTGKDSGYILYYYMGMEEYDRNNYYVGISRFTLDKKGGYVFDETDEENYLLRNSYGDPYTGRWVNTDKDNFYIDVVKRGDNYYFDVQCVVDEAELHEWKYTTGCAEYREGYEWTYFVCDEGGTYTIYSTDTKTGKEDKNVIYNDTNATFILDGDELEWHDYKDDVFEAYFEERFVKLEE